MWTSTWRKTWRRVKHVASYPWSSTQVLTDPISLLLAYASLPLPPPPPLLPQLLLQPLTTTATASTTTTNINSDSSSGTPSSNSRSDTIATIITPRMTMITTTTCTNTITMTTQVRKQAGRLLLCGPWGHTSTQMHVQQRVNQYIATARYTSLTSCPPTHDDPRHLPNHCNAQGPKR